MGKDIEIENLTLTLAVVKGEYVVKKPLENRTSLHTDSIEYVLNYYGKKGWVLKQVSSDETELVFYRNKIHWFKKLIIDYPKIIYKRKNIYEKGGKYYIGTDIPLGDPSFENLYLDSVQDIINHLESKYGLMFVCQSPDIKVGDENLIRMYFMKKRSVAMSTILKE